MTPQRSASRIQNIQIAFCQRAGLFAQRMRLPDRKTHSASAACSGGALGRAQDTIRTANRAAWYHEASAYFLRGACQHFGRYSGDVDPTDGDDPYLSAVMSLMVELMAVLPVQSYFEHRLSPVHSMIQMKNSFSAAQIPSLTACCPIQGLRYRGRGLFRTHTL